MSSTCDREHHDQEETGSTPVRRPAISSDSDGNLHLYLITSRGSGRWIIPKGNAIRGLPPHKVAAREALEEAGLVGHIRRGCIGTFRFNRRRGSTDKTYYVEVYALEVERQKSRWTELGERSVRRCDLQTALSLLTWPELSTVIEQFLASPASAAEAL